MNEKTTHKFICVVALTLLFANSIPGLGVAQEQKTDGQQIIDQLRALQLSSRAFRAAVAKVEPALVTIESFGGSGAIAGRIGGIRQQGEGNTTGLLIDDAGHIVTSTFNFIQRPPVITVITADGERHVAKLLGKDNTRKLCLLKIDNPPQNVALTYSAIDEMKVGQWTISIGVGFGDSNPAISTGILSAKNRVGGKAIQTDANVSPACYGGPLIDIDGQVMGICVPLNPQSQAIGAGVEWYDSGIGFAIPLKELGDMLDRLKAGESIEPAFLGIQPLAGEQENGLLIQEVVPDSPASAAGLQSADLLLSLNGEAITDIMKLKQILSRMESGQTVKLKYKDGATEKEHEVDVILGTPPVPKDQPQLEPPEIR